MYFRIASDNACVLYFGNQFGTVDYNQMERKKGLMEVLFFQRTNYGLPRY